MVKKAIIKSFEFYADEEGTIFAIVRGKFKRLSQNERSGGYKYVTVSKNGKQSKVSVHRIVCTAFHDNPSMKSQVNHIDGNPRNNSSSNLEWNTPSENQTHSRYVLGNATGFRDRAIICVDTGKKYVSTRDAWRETGVNYCHISECASGKRKTAGGMVWKYDTHG